MKVTYTGKCQWIIQPSTTTDPWNSAMFVPPIFCFISKAWLLSLRICYLCDVEWQSTTLQYTEINKKTQRCCTKMQNDTKYSMLYVHGLLWFQYSKSDHDDVIKWKDFPRYWLFVRGIHRSPVNSPHKGQWRGALMFSSICACINGWVNNREAGDLRRHCSHYDVICLTKLPSPGFIYSFISGQNTCTPL